MGVLNLQPLAIALALTAFTASPVFGLALAPRASGAPSCAYVCPSKDQLNNVLASSTVVETNQSVAMDCKYQQGPYTGVCRFNKADGSFISGVAGRFQCPETLNYQCATTVTIKRDSESVYEVYQRKRRERRAAKPVGSVPEYMATRVQLKKRNA